MDNREIDALVAEKVMGWEPHDNGEGEIVWTHNPTRQWSVSFGHVPHYSESIKAAWEVVEKNIDLGFEINCRSGWAAYFGEHIAYADSAPLAICLAALKSKGIAVKTEL